MKAEIELDCSMDFDYDESCDQVTFANTDFQIMIPNKLLTKFKSIDEKEWVKIVSDAINLRVKNT